MEQQYLLEMRGISKRFAGIRALDDVDFSLRPGTVHALMGENGAGKSSLMNILIGIHQPDSGTIRFQGREVSIKNPRNAMDLGFAMIHQELLQMEEMSVADNVFMGRFPKGAVLNHKKISGETRRVFEMLGIYGIRPEAKIKMLSLAQRQLIEIAKAVSVDAKVIIMDEPTSALMDREIDILFKIIEDLRSQGRAIIYISHKMEEIFKIADEITVLRDGRLIGSDLAANLNNDLLVRMMVGRELKDMFDKALPSIGGVALAVEHLSSKDCFEDVSFEVHRGEVVGFAGLMGAGRSEIMETIFGLRKKTSGAVFKDGKPLVVRRPRDAIRSGIALVTEDRKKTGLFLKLPIRFNISISSLFSMNKSCSVPKRQETEQTQKISQALRVKAVNLAKPVSSLSGGNQQKVVLAKWMMTEPDILILDEPTRGIDVGAKKEIYSMIDRIAASGKAVVVVSSEMPEILGVSDRIVVIHEGHKKGELMRAEATQEKIMSLLTE